MHLGEKPHSCDVCSRSFLRQRDLQRHIQIHMSQKKYQCPFCDKSFSRLDHLRSVHMRVHEPWKTGAIRRKAKRVEKSLEPADPGGTEDNSEGINLQYRLFDCQKCEKKFTTKAKLDKHLVLHSGQKAHKCTDCGRSFALASYLRAHENTHRKQEGYLQCPKCPRRFVSQETLSVHDEKFHGRIEKMKKFPDSESNEKGAGRSKDISLDISDEERFFASKDFDVNLNLEDEINIQEVELFDPASLTESEKNNTFVYLHVISDDLLLTNENSLM